MADCLNQRFRQHLTKKIRAIRVIRDSDNIPTKKISVISAIRVIRDLDNISTKTTRVIRAIRVIRDSDKHAGIQFEAHTPMPSRTGKIKIGISNVVVPGNKTTFPPAFQQKSRLHYYSHLFNTVELNSPFYKTPLRSTFEKWANDVPEDFRFSIKLSKEITHTKELKSDLSLIEPFMNAAEGLGKKKGCLLIQFPGKITLDYYEQVESILEELDRVDSKNEWKKSVKFRHNSWYTSETWELLDEFNSGMVLHDIPKSKIHLQKGKAPFVYLRFHGPDGDYRNSYSDAILLERAEAIKDWAKKGKDVFVYFNNTIGDAFNDANRLKRLLELPTGLQK